MCQSSAVHFEFRVTCQWTIGTIPCAGGGGGVENAERLKAIRN